MYLIAYEDDTKLDKVQTLPEIYEICRNLNEDALATVEDEKTEDVSDMNTNRFKELLNVYAEGISVYDIKDVIEAVEQSEIEDEEKAAILEVLKDEDVARFNLEDFYSLPEILVDIEELSF